MIHQGYFIKFNVDGLLRGITRAVCRAMPQQGRMAGCRRMTSVSLKTLTVFPAEDGGDLYLINGNMMPLSMSGAAYGKEETQNEEVLELEELDGSGQRNRRGNHREGA